MSNEQNKAMYRRFYEEVFSGGNLAALDELMDVNFDDHDEPNPIETLVGLERVKEAITMYRSAFPDVHFTVED